MVGGRSRGLDRVGLRYYRGSGRSYHVLLVDGARLHPCTAQGCVSLGNTVVVGGGVSVREIPCFIGGGVSVREIPCFIGGGVSP